MKAETITAATIKQTLDSKDMAGEGGDDDAGDGMAVVAAGVAENKAYPGGGRGA